MLRPIMLTGLGIALFASACSSATAEGSSVDPSTAAEYLAEVREIEGEYASGFADIREATTQSYATRNVLFGAVEDAGFAEAAERALSRAAATSPPPGLTRDHDTWIQYRSAIENISEDDYGQAIENGNLQELLAILTTFEQQYGSLLANTGREFCLAASIDPDLCTAGDDLPGDEYGQRIHEILRQNKLRSFGLFTFPDDMSAEERSVRLGEVQPRIESSLKAAGDAMAQITPPDEFAADHAAFLRYFEEQYGVAGAITKANAEGDDGRVLELFRESGVVAGRVAQAESSGFARISAPFRADDFTNRGTG